MTAYRGEDIFVKMLLVFGILAAFVDRTIKLGVVAQNSNGGNLGDVNISALLTSFQTGYDKRVRPNYGGPAVVVGVTLYVLSISSLSEVEMVQHKKQVVFKIINIEPNVCNWQRF
jgi:glycine receptor alpha-3